MRIFKQLEWAREKAGLSICLMLSLLLSIGLVQVSFASDELLSELGGRVLDTQRNPVAGAQVKLLDELGNMILSTASSVDGTFSLKHRQCDYCTLQVVPDEKSSLASALIERIPGNANRQFLVTLQQGFRVSGRVTGDGKGLKGLTVKVVAAGVDSQHVHSGGQAKTVRGGAFEMNLTPGPKKLSVENDRYTNFVSKYEHDLMVTSDRELSEIKLPFAR